MAAIAASYQRSQCNLRKQSCAQFQMDVDQGGNQGLLGLPAVELGLMLEKVSFRDCFQGAALSCTALHKAVLAAAQQQLSWTTKVCTPQEAVDSFLRYLEVRGQQLNRLVIAYDSTQLSTLGCDNEHPFGSVMADVYDRFITSARWGRPKTGDFYHHPPQLQLSALPCSSLRELELEHFKLQLGPSSRSNSQPGLLPLVPGLLCQLPHLTCLRLNACSINSSSDLLAVTSLSDLRSLTLRNIVILDYKGKSALAPGTAPEPAFQHMLSSCAHLPLRELQLYSSARPLYYMDSIRVGQPPAPVTAADLADIGCFTQLTSLNCGGHPLPFVLWGRDCLIIYPTMSQQLSALTALRSLSLTDSLFDPVVLPSLPQLQDLSLVRIRGGEGLPLPAASAGSAAGSSSGGAVLLSALAVLTQLTSLSIKGIRIRWPALSALYSALTASSKLQRLCLNFNSKTHGHEFSLPPEGFWQCPALLPATRQLPHLTAWDSRHAADPMDQPALARLVSLAPSVQQLCVEVQPDTDLSALQPLTALQSLGVRCCMELTPPCPALLSLTALTGLTHLYLENTRYAHYRDERDKPEDYDQQRQRFEATLSSLRRLKTITWGDPCQVGLCRRYVAPVAPAAAAEPDAANPPN